MKFKRTPKKVSKVVDYGISGVLFASSLLAGRLGYTSYKSSMLSGAILLPALVNDFSAYLNMYQLDMCQSDINYAFLSTNARRALHWLGYNDNEIRSGQVPRSDTAIVAGTSWLIINIGKVALLSNNNMGGNGSYIGMIGARAAASLLANFIKRKFLENYQFQEVDATNPDETRDCSPLKNNLLIGYFSLLGAAMSVTSSLAANILMQRYAERISDCIGPGRLCNIATSPMLYTMVFQLLESKVLRCSDYTHEACVISYL